MAQGRSNIPRAAFDNRHRSNRRGRSPRFSAADRRHRAAIGSRNPRYRENRRRWRSEARCRPAHGRRGRFQRQCRAPRRCRRPAAGARQWLSASRARRYRWRKPADRRASATATGRRHGPCGRGSRRPRRRGRCRPSPAKRRAAGLRQGRAGGVCLWPRSESTPGPSCRRRISAANSPSLYSSHSLPIRRSARH